MNSAQMDNVLTVTRLVATVVSIGTIGVLLWYGWQMRVYMRNALSEIRSLSDETRTVQRNLAALGVQILNYDMARRVSVVQNSQYAQPERAFCPTCKSTTAQEYSPATGKPLTTKCTLCGNSRPL